MTEPGWPALDPTIDVDASAGDLDQLWDRFEVFEALHHRQRICNPMREAELEGLLDLLAPNEATSMLDIACGSGELLIRSHERGLTTSLGLDLSPWMLRAAASEARARLPGVGPNWLLADAARMTPPPTSADLVACVGADWIWHGMHGTIAAIAELTAPGGRLAYGGPRLHFDADPAATSATFGRLETAADVERRLHECGLAVSERIDPGEDGWLDYLERGRNDALEWQRHHPGPRADAHVETQREWSDQYAADRGIVGWSVWIADRVA